MGMLSNQYENSTDKIPTSALVYALKQSTDQLNGSLTYKTLTKGFDLNNALGMYRSESSIVINSLINKPDFVSGEVTIDWYPAEASGRYGVQILRRSIANAYPQVWYRSRFGGPWSNWIKNVTNEDFPSWKLLSIGNVTPKATTIALNDTYKFSSLSELNIIAQINSTVRGTLVIPISKFIDGQDCYITCTAESTVITMHIKYVSATTYTCSCSDPRLNYVRLYGR